MAVQQPQTPYVQIIRRTFALLLALAVLAVIAAYAVWRYKAGYVKTDKTELTRDPE